MKEKGKAMKELKGVVDTLYFPLYARIEISKNFPEYFYDERALSIEALLPEEIKAGASEYSNMDSAARYFSMDRLTAPFIEEHSNCNLVYLGAGLETAYDRLKKRVNTEHVQVYQLDLHQAIETRRTVLGQAVGEVLLAEDMFEFTWIERMDKSLPTLLVAAGVFQYFEEEIILAFIKGLKESFPKCELLFDATNEKGLAYANWFLRRTGNKDVQMHFFINDGDAFAKRTSTSLLKEQVFFREARAMLGKKLKRMTRLFMKVADAKKRTMIYHLKLN